MGGLVGCWSAGGAPHGPLGSPADLALERPADNSFCYVCHLNFKADTLAERHKVAGVGCMYCHGNSDDHSADEDGLTPPEVMFRPDKINPACMTCHNGHRRKYRSAPAVVLKSAPATPCTGCHGDHRLAVRTRRWDKTTGKLIYDDGVRMIDHVPNGDSCP